MKQTGIDQWQTLPANQTALLWDKARLTDQAVLYRALPLVSQSLRFNELHSVLPPVLMNSEVSLHLPISMAIFGSMVSASDWTIDSASRRTQWNAY